MPWREGPSGTGRLWGPGTPFPLVTPASGLAVCLRLVSSQRRMGMFFMHRRGDYTGKGGSVSPQEIRNSKSPETPPSTLRLTGVGRPCGQVWQRLQHPCVPASHRSTKRGGHRPGPRLARACALHRLKAGAEQACGLWPVCARRSGGRHRHCECRPSRAEQQLPMTLSHFTRGS